MSREDICFAKTECSLPFAVAKAIFGARYARIVYMLRKKYMLCKANLAALAQKRIQISLRSHKMHASENLASARTPLPLASPRAPFSACRRAAAPQWFFVDASADASTIASRCTDVCFVRGGNRMH